MEPTKSAFLRVREATPSLGISSSAAYQLAKAWLQRRKGRLDPPPRFVSDVESGIPTRCHRASRCRGQ